MKPFISLSIIGCLALFACSREEHRALGVENAGVTLNLSVENRAGNGFGTRVRELYSQEALQEIYYIEIFAYKKEGSDYKYHSLHSIPGWSVGVTQGQYPIPAGALESGEYTFVANGYASGDSYMSINPPTVGESSLQDLILGVPLNSMLLNELFSGRKATAIPSPTGTVEVELARKVAGILGYFKNIPAELDNQTVASLRLTISDLNTQVSLTADTGSVKLGEPYDLFNIDLTGLTPTPEGVYPGSDLSAAGIQKLDNSQLIGKFVFPIKGVTLTLGLYDGSDNPLRTWEVLYNNQKQVDLAANSFYSIGQKLRRDNTTGLAPGDPDDPTKADNAIDLSRDFIITLSNAINLEDDTWDGINQ